MSIWNNLHEIKPLKSLCLNIFSDSKMFIQEPVFNQEICTTIKVVSRLSGFTDYWIDEDEVSVVIVKTETFIVYLFLLKTSIT